MNLGVLLAVLPIVLSAGRIVLFAGGDPVLMRVLIETLDTQALLLGTILPALLIFIWLAVQPLLFPVQDAKRLFGVGKKGEVLRLVLAVCLLLVGASLAPGSVIVSAVLTIISAVFILRMVIPKGMERWRSWRKCHFFQFLVKEPTGRGAAEPKEPVVLAILILVVPLLVFLSPGPMWLPLEKVTVDGEEHIAYVLQTREGWATLMEADRTVLRVQASLLEDRVVCDQGEYNSFITWRAGERGSNLPTCTEVASSHLVPSEPSPGQ